MDNLKVINQTNKLPRAWLTIDADHSILHSEEIQNIIEETQERLKKLGVTMKIFPHDPNFSHED